MYEKEVVDQTAKVEKMKEEKKDEHDIKKQVCCVTTLELLCATVKKLRIYAHKTLIFYPVLINNISLCGVSVIICL